MKLIKQLFWTLSMAIAFVGCSEVNNSPTEQASPVLEMVELEDNVSGAADQTRVVAFVFKEPASISEAAEAISRHQVDVLSVKFYVDGVTGTVGNAQAQSPEKTFTNLRLSLDSNIKTSLQDDKAVIAPNLLELTREEFEASQQWQMEAIGLLDRARQREAMAEALQGKKAVIHTVTLQGKVEELRSFATELALEGVANLVFGSRLMTPKPESVRLREVSTLRVQQTTLSSNNLYEQTKLLIRETLDVQAFGNTGVVVSNAFELAPTAASQSFANRGSLSYRSPGFVSGGRVQFDEVNIYAYWDNPGDWNFPYSGVELDFNVYNRNIYGGCTSTTNLPYGYDDCPTAGVSESNRTYYGFGFGSFVARQIRARYRYYGFIDLYASRFYTNRTTFDWNVSGQENARIPGCPGVYDIWCRQAKASANLVTNPNFRTGSSGSASW